MSADVCGVKSVSTRVVHIFQAVAFLPHWLHAAVWPRPVVQLPLKAKARIRDGGEAYHGLLLYLDWQMNSSFTQALFTKGSHPHLWESCLKRSRKQRPWKACCPSFSPSLLDRHQSNNVMFWFKIRGGTLLEMTSLLVPEFDCLWPQRRELVFSLYSFSFKAISMIQMNQNAVTASDCIDAVYEYVLTQLTNLSLSTLWLCHTHKVLSVWIYKQTQTMLPPTNPVSVLNRFGMTQLDVLAPTLLHIFQHFSSQFQTKHQKQDHSTMIKGKTQNEK